MFDFSSTAMGMGIQNVLNNAVQISYRGLMCGLINMTLTAVMGGSWEQAKSSFVTGFILGAGISVVRYFAVGAELVTLARFYVLSASANFIFSATMTVFAVTKGYSNLAVTFGVMVILSIAEWCWAYGNYLLIDVYGNNGSATIECNPSGDESNVGVNESSKPNVNDGYNKRNTPDQDALIQLAKEAKKSGGATYEDAEILIEWAKEYDVPYHEIEVHLNRPGAASNIPHFHIGKTGHIPIVGDIPTWLEEVFYEN